MLTSLINSIYGVLPVARADAPACLIAILLLVGVILTFVLWVRDVLAQLPRS